MYRESNITRKRKALGVMLISEESKAKLRARLDSEEGQRCLTEFAKLLEDWGAEMLPAGILRALGVHRSPRSDRRAVARRRQYLLQSPLEPRHPKPASSLSVSATNSTLCSSAASPPVS
jgi:hypothetical protein